MNLEEKMLAPFLFSPFRSIVGTGEKYITMHLIFPCSSCILPLAKCSAEGSDENWPLKPRMCSVAPTKRSWAFKLMPNVPNTCSMGVNAKFNRTDFFSAFLKGLKDLGKLPAFFPRDSFKFPVGFKSIARWL